MGFRNKCSATVSLSTVIGTYILLEHSRIAVIHPFIHAAAAMQGPASQLGFSVLPRMWTVGAGIKTAHPSIINLQPTLLAKPQMPYYITSVIIVSNTVILNKANYSMYSRAKYSSTIN